MVPHKTVTFWAVDYEVTCYYYYCTTEDLDIR